MEIENLYIILQIRTPYTISRFSILQFKYNTAFAIITVIENNVMSKQEDIYIYIYKQGRGTTVFERKNLYWDNTEKNDVQF